MDQTGQPLSWSSIYAAGAANPGDIPAYIRNSGPGGRFDIQQQDKTSIPLRGSGNVGVGIYGVAAGFSQTFIDTMIVGVLTLHGARKAIAQDQYWAHVGIDFAKKHCK
jgi:hypothetical protein